MEKYASKYLTVNTIYRVVTFSSENFHFIFKLNEITIPPFNYADAREKIPSSKIEARRFPTASFCYRLIKHRRWLYDDVSQQSFRLFQQPGRESNGAARIIFNER